MGADALLIDIPTDLDLAGAAAERARVLALLDAGPGASVALSLASEAATQPSLQIFLATLKEARLRGLAVEIAPGAGAALAQGLTPAAEEGAR